MTFFINKFCIMDYKQPIRDLQKQGQRQLYNQKQLIDQQSNANNFMNSPMTEESVNRLYPHSTKQRYKAFPKQSNIVQQVITQQQKEETSTNHRVMRDNQQQKQKYKYKPSYYFSNKQRHHSKAQSRSQSQHQSILEQKKSNKTEKQESRFDYFHKLTKQRSNKDDERQKRQLLKNKEEEDDGEQSSLKSQILPQHNLFLINDSPNRQNFTSSLMKWQNQNKEEPFNQKRNNNTTLNNQVQHSNQQQFLSDGRLKAEYLRQYQIINQFKNSLDASVQAIKSPLKNNQQLQSKNPKSSHFTPHIKLKSNEDNRQSSQRKKIFSNISPMAIKQITTNNKNISPPNPYGIKQQQNISHVNFTSKSQSVNKQYFSNNLNKYRNINFAKIKRELINSRIKYYRSNQKDIISSIQKKKIQLIMNIHQQQTTPEKRKTSQSQKSPSLKNSKDTSPKNSKRNSPKNYKKSPKNTANKKIQKQGNNGLNMMIVDEIQRNEENIFHNWYQHHKLQIEAQSQRICEFDLINRYLSSSQIEASLQNFIASKIEPKRWILLIVDQVYGRLKDRYRV